MVLADEERNVPAVFAQVENFGRINYLFVRLKLALKVVPLLTTTVADTL